MAWVPIVDTRIDTNSPLDTDLFTDLRGNIREARQYTTAYQYAEQSTGSATFVTLVTRDIWIPSLTDYSGLQRSISNIVEVAVSTNVGSFRLLDTASGTFGPTQTTTVIYPTFEDATLTLDVPAAWAGSRRQIEVQAQRGTGGTAYSQSVDRIACTVFY